MERRDFLKIALGAAGGAAALAATAQAAPLSPHPLVEEGRQSATQDAHPAVTNENEVDRVSPEEVRWWRRRWHPRHDRRWHRGRHRVGL
jgi:TAT (twin-arginine translocation) pathway signal sequence